MKTKIWNYPLHLICIFLVLLCVNVFGQKSNETVTDIVGNVYHTVKIGKQVWMVENLKTTKFNDGRSIPNVTNGNEWINIKTPGYCWYNNDVANKKTYGALYNWYAVNNGKLAPKGWHVPSNTEIITLTDFYRENMVAGGKLKESGFAHWISPNKGATNETGFTALPCGIRYNYRVKGGTADGTFTGIGVRGTWWSSTDKTSSIEGTAASFSLSNYDEGMENICELKNNGFSVRCIKDDKVNLIINSEFGNESDRIEKYIMSNSVKVQPTKDGIYIIEDVKGNGPKPGPKDYIKVHYSISTIEGKLFYSSFKNAEPHLMKMDTKLETTGLKEGLKLLSKGSKARLIVPSNMAFGKGEIGGADPDTPILYEVELIDVMSETQYEEQKPQNIKDKEAIDKKAYAQEKENLKKYLSNLRNLIKPTPSGLYYIELKKGSGSIATNGKKVKVHYEGKLINGTIFDSSKKRGIPIEFEIGNHNVIPGLDEGISKMRVGGKARLIIPSSLGYGSQEITLVPSYSTLIYDVELIDIK